MVTSAINDNTSFEEEVLRLQATLNHTREIHKRFINRLNDPSRVIDLAERKELLEDIAEMDADIAEMQKACAWLA